MSFLIGVDVGGTFTDFSTFDTETGVLKHFKQSSTPEDPSRAMSAGSFMYFQIMEFPLLRLAIWPTGQRWLPML